MHRRAETLPGVKLQVSTTSAAIGVRSDRRCAPGGRGGSVGSDQREASGRPGLAIAGGVYYAQKPVSSSDLQHSEVCPTVGLVLGPVSCLSCSPKEGGL